MILIHGTKNHDGLQGQNKLGLELPMQLPLVLVRNISIWSTDKQVVRLSFWIKLGTNNLHTVTAPVHRQVQN